MSKITTDEIIEQDIKRDYTSLQLFYFRDAVSALKKMRNEPDGLSLYHLAKAVWKSLGDKEELKAVIKELQKYVE